MAAEHEIEFSRELQARGRNGMMQCLGIEVYPLKDAVPERGAYVELSPINSRGVSRSAYIQIPVEDLDALIDLLRQTIEHCKA